MQTQTISADPAAGTSTGSDPATSTTTSSAGESTTNGSEEPSSATEETVPASIDGFFASPQFSFSLDNLATSL